MTLLGRRTILGALAGWPISAAAQPQTDAAADEYALTLLPASGARLGAEVYVNRTGPWRFVVDTGANRTVISSELSTHLGLRPGPTMQVHGIASPFAAQSAVVRELRLDKYRYGPFQAPVLPRAALGADGLLGIDVLQKRLVSLDMAASRLEIGSSEARTGSRMTRRVFEDRSVIARARQRSGQLTIVHAWAGDVRIEAFLDTGAERSVGNLALRRAVRARHPNVAGQALTIDIMGATGQLVRGEVAMLPNLRLGGARLGAFGTVFADLHTFALWDIDERPALMVGMDLLSLFRSIALDFSRREVRFRLYSGLETLTRQA